MEITIDIPDSIATPLDTFFKTVDGPTFTDGANRKITPKRFPDGLRSYIGENVAAILRNAAEHFRDVLPVPELDAKRQEVEAKQKEITDFFNPTVR